MKTAQRLLVVLLALAVLDPSVALALNINGTAVKGLSQAYGFVVGQEHTLDRVAKEHPELESAVHLARARFSLAFPDIGTRLAAELRGAMGSENFDQFARQATDTMRATLDRQPITSAAAAEFIREVEARARGDIESPVLEYLLAVKYAANPGNELADGFHQRFDTDGTGRARGIRLSLRLPRSWIARDGERPHIVKKWTSEGGTGREIVMLDVRDAEGYEPDKREIERFLRSGEVKEVVPEGAALIASGAFTVEGRPGYWADMRLRQERVGVALYQRMLMYQLFFRGRAIGVMCQTVGSPREAARVDESLSRLRPVCQQVVNSLVLHQAY